MASKAESARSGIASLSGAHFLLRDELKERLRGRPDLAIFLGFKHLFHSMQALWVWDSHVELGADVPRWLPIISNPTRICAITLKHVEKELIVVHRGRYTM